MTGLRRAMLALACLLLVGLPAGCDIATTTPGFHATGSMSVSRMGHVAVGLAGGRVLVLGGYSAPEGQSLALLASAEIYDPDAGSFGPTGSMQTARSAMTATLLGDGRVLVAGGYTMDAAGASVPLASAEIYDPGNGTFSRTGSMSVARYNHTATMLPDGKILIAGGTGQGGSVASAELYDPANGTFSPTGSMTVERTGHTAVALGNGKVLVAGGAQTARGRQVEYLASAELYDPDAATFTLTPSLSTARYNHIAELLPNGRVLVAGGLRLTDTSARASLSSAELFDPAGTTVEAAASMASSRSEPACVRLSNGRVLLAGGLVLAQGGGGGASYLDAAEVFDPDSGTWLDAGSMTVKRAGATATLISGGRVLIVGGGDNRETLSSAEIYQP